MPKWIPEETSRLIKLRDEQEFPWERLAPMFGRSIPAVKAEYCRGKKSPEQRERDRLYHLAYRRMHRGTELEGYRAFDGGLDRTEIDRRIIVASNLRHRDLTGELCGDPPVGRSALDIKQGTYVG